jgi:RHS repeat-associated protein
MDSEFFRILLAAVAGPVSASFVYDALGRRSRKTINGVQTDFLYDALNPVQEQSGSVITNMLTGLGIDEYFSRGDAASTSFFLADALGSTIALADSSGGLPTAYTYEPFGLTSTSGATTSTSYDFTARESDLTGLKYYRARYYHPRLQRFMTEDPLTCVLRTGRHVYSYAENNPVSYTDPLGLDKNESCIGCQAGRVYEFMRCMAANYKSPNAPGVGLPQLILSCTLCVNYVRFGIFDPTTCGICAINVGVAIAYVYDCYTVASRIPCPSCR